MIIHDRKDLHRKKKKTSLALTVALSLCLCVVLGVAAAGYAQELPQETVQPEQEYTVIDEGETPLAVVETQGIWSVLNLVLAGAGGVLAVIMLSMGLFSEKSEARLEDAYAYHSAQERPQRKVSLPWMVASILMGTSAIVLFMLTQNIDETMVLMDRWTPLMAAVVIIQLIFAVLAFRKRYEASAPRQYARP